MAIVRTTPKETGTTGKAPSSMKNAPVPQRGSRTTIVQRSAARANASKPNASGDFIVDVQAELRRVTWPTPEEVRSGVIVTIGLLVFFAFYIFGLDYVAQHFVGAMVDVKP